MQASNKIAGILCLTTLSGLLSTAVTLPATANNEACVVDRNNRITCGRLATQEEIWRYRGRSSRSNNHERDNRNRVEREINKIYREILERNADRDGLRAYTNRVVSGGWSISKVRRDVANSREAKEKINQIYRNILRRNVDRNGLEYYVNRLERGWEMSDVRRDVADSREARNRRRDRDDDDDD